MSSLPQPVEVKDPGHALVTPGHAPVTTASTTPGHAPVDATLAVRALKKDDFSTMSTFKISCKSLAAIGPPMPRLGAASIHTYMHTAITPSGGITRGANKIHCPLMARKSTPQPELLVPEFPPAAILQPAR